MKLSTRLGFVVGIAALGAAILVVVALQGIRSSMTEDRHAQITQTLNLVKPLIGVYVEQEKSGKFTRDEAQARAKEALAGLRHGSDYIFVRDFSGRMLVHPDAARVGKMDPGPKLPDGRTTFQTYLDLLKTADSGIVRAATLKPGTKESIPKLNGLVKISEWDWMVGYGLFIDDIDTAYQHNAIRFIVIGLVIFALVVGMAFLLARGIYRALGGEPEQAAAMAKAIARGDLTQQFGEGVPAESLMESIQQMQSNLRNIIGTIQRNADKVGSASSGLTEQMQLLSDASRQSSDAVSSTAAAIEEMAVSVDHISQSARDTESNATTATHLAEEGERLMNKAAGEIQTVAHQVSDASGMIGELVVRSNEIGGIARVIKEIADQTNLLALNAAIEAARAGEQGRGFAVVADEVRKLAERTAQATDQITTMISAIHRDTSNVVSGMQAVGPQVAQGIAIIGEVGQALHKINDATIVAKGNISEVAAATSEQSQASSNVARNVEQISSMIEATLHSVNEANTNVVSLEQLASELRQSISQFKTT